MGNGRVTGVQLEAARQLLAAEGGDAQTRVGIGEAAARVFDKLHLHLDPLLGAAGVQALFVRGGRLAAASHPCVNPAPESAARLRECLDPQSDGEAMEAAVAFFAAFLSVISGFIGAGLTAELLRGAWPAVTLVAEPENKQ